MGPQHVGLWGPHKPKQVVQASRNRVSRRMGKSVIKRWGDGEAPTIGGTLNKFKGMYEMVFVDDVVNFVVVTVEMMGLPSGKLLHNYGKSPFLMGKSTISMAIFNSYFDITRGYLTCFLKNPYGLHAFRKRRGSSCASPDSWIARITDRGFGRTLRGYQIEPLKIHWLIDCYRGFNPTRFTGDYDGPHRIGKPINQLVFHEMG